MSSAFLDRRGFSLLEVLVAAALFCLLAVSIVQVIIPSLRMVAVTSQRGGMQQHALIVLTRIEAALRRSADAGIRVEPQALSVHRHQQASPFPGEIRWENGVVLYQLLGGEIIERVYLGLTLDSTRPWRPSQSEFQQLQTRTATQRSVLARGVKEFRVERTPQAAYTITLELVGAPVSEKFRLTRTIALRM